MYWFGYTVRNLFRTFLLRHSTDFVALLTTTLFLDHSAYLVFTGPDTLLRHHLAHLIGPDTLLRNHFTDPVLTCPDALLRHHSAHLIGTRPDALLGHHPTDLIGPNTLLWHLSLIHI